MERIKFTVAGVAFYGFVLRYAADSTEGKPGAVAHVTVPTPALKKILESGRVKVTRNYSLSDDYARDAKTGGKIEDVNPEVVLKILEEHKGRKPWLCSLDKNGTITYCPYSNESWQIKAIKP